MTDLFKLRGGVYFVNSIPTSATGKAIRPEVKKIATNLYRTRMENGKQKQKL